MQIHDYIKYDWNRCVAPYGNMAKVDPTTVAELCDKFGLPWYTDGCPHTSGIKAYCVDNDLWRDVITMSKTN